MAPGCEHDWSEASLCPDSWCQTRQGLTSVNTVVRARWDQDGNGIQGLPWISDISSCHCGFRTIFSIFFPWLVWGQCGHCPVVVCLREVWEWVLREWRRSEWEDEKCATCVCCPNWRSGMENGGSKFPVIVKSHTVNSSFLQDREALKNTPASVQLPPSIALQVTVGLRTAETWKVFYHITLIVVCF